MPKLLRKEKKRKELVRDKSNKSSTTSMTVAEIIKISD